MNLAFDRASSNLAAIRFRSDNVVKCRKPFEIYFKFQSDRTGSMDLNLRLDATDSLQRYFDAAAALFRFEMEIPEPYQDTDSRMGLTQAEVAQSQVCQG